MRPGSESRSRGVIYIAYGPQAVAEAQMSIASLRKWHQALPVLVVGDPVAGADQVLEMERQDAGGRAAKVRLDQISPFESTLYIDADTRLRGDISLGFDIIEDGWDLAVVPSTQQRHDLLWHIDPDERQATLVELGIEPLQLQAGVLFFGRSARVSALFERWRSEWARWEDQDQGALLRAIYTDPPRIWLLGRPYNGGSLVSHLFGKAREVRDE